MVLGLFVALILSLSPGMSCINLILPTMAQITGRSRSRAGEGEGAGAKEPCPHCFQIHHSFFSPKGKKPYMEKMKDSIY